VLEKILLINCWIQECKGFERDRELKNDEVAIVAWNNLIVPSTIGIGPIRHIRRYWSCCCYAGTWWEGKSCSLIRLARGPYTDLMVDGFVQFRAPKIKDWVPFISAS